MKIEPGADLGLRSEGIGAEAPVAEAPAPGGGADFGAVLERTVEGANRLQKAAAASAEALARGATDDLHGTMITTKEAEIAIKLVGSVRNKLLDAFHELWRINL